MNLHPGLLAISLAPASPYPFQLLVWKGSKRRFTTSNTFKKLAEEHPLLLIQLLIQWPVVPDSWSIFITGRDTTEHIAERYAMQYFVHLLILELELIHLKSALADTQTEVQQYLQIH